MFLFTFCLCAQKPYTFLLAWRIILSHFCSSINFDVSCASCFDIHGLASRNYKSLFTNTGPVPYKMFFLNAKQMDNFFLTWTFRTMCTALTSFEQKHLLNVLWKRRRTS